MRGLSSGASSLKELHARNLLEIAKIKLLIGNQSVRRFSGESGVVIEANGFIESEIVDLQTYLQ